MPYFTHLHVHSHYSILDGMSKVPDLISKCKRNGMYAMALTDHGNMFGIKELVDTVKKENGKVKDKIKELEAKKAELEAKIKEVEELYSNTEVPEGTPRLSDLQEEAAAIDPQLAALNGQFFKPIIGIETYCAHRTLYDKDPTVKERDPETGRDRITDRSGWHLILLAKNKQGYKNLCKLSSIAFTEGFFYHPRIDHNLL